MAQTMDVVVRDRKALEIQRQKSLKKAQGGVKKVAKSVRNFELRAMPFINEKYVRENLDFSLDNSPIYPGDATAYFSVVGFDRYGDLRWDEQFKTRDEIQASWPSLLNQLLVLKNQEMVFLGKRNTSQGYFSMWLLRVN